MNPQSLGGRRVRPHGPDVPELCQAVSVVTERRCTDTAGHLFSTPEGEVVAFCCLHREHALANRPEYIPFDLFSGPRGDQP